jgi:hypothetical protein
METVAAVGSCSGVLFNYHHTSKKYVEVKLLGNMLARKPYCILYVICLYHVKLPILHMFMLVVSENTTSMVLNTILTLLHSVALTLYM